MGMFDLEKHFAFYGSYHNNPVNIFIHMLFVWPIFFTALVLFYFTPPIFSDSKVHLCCHTVLVFNFGFLLAVVYGIYYIGMDRKAGCLGALLCFLCWVSSSHLAHRLGFSCAWKKRAPALLDNLAQAFLMAPFFVLLEALQSFFGYEPYPGFHDSVQAKIDAEIKEWKEKQKKKNS
ncbi:PREDICTED: uncharacterized endoplasmic reticulum membrane protein C16E8.02-like isoform X2 [Ipomoea nil]|uniref:uncharacterized endoplasmic reticulum membrane protein C16E8.02-like isoform X2 n=1 Tax=Ipomoea nil TaxID=35883 RepID=UPI000901EC0D|nr:PREDICTED: uncharacterized endoplasmic reticulum membrane protein C16E8.02-like isoform X2 [Ipomoea nil]